QGEAHVAEGGGGGTGAGDRGPNDLPGGDGRMPSPAISGELGFRPHAPSPAADRRLHGGGEEAVYQVTRTRGGLTGQTQDDRTWPRNNHQATCPSASSTSSLRTLTPKPSLTGWKTTRRSSGAWWRRSWVPRHVWESARNTTRSSKPRRKPPKRRKRRRSEPNPSTSKSPTRWAGSSRRCFFRI